MSEDLHFDFEMLEERFSPAIVSLFSGFETEKITAPIVQIAR